MNRFVRRLPAAVVASLGVLWVTAVSACAVRVPLDQDISPYQTGVPVDLTPAAATSTSGATSWLLGVALVALVVGLAYVGRGTAHRHQGSLSAR